MSFRFLILIVAAAILLSSCQQKIPNRTGSNSTSTSSAQNSSGQSNEPEVIATRLDTPWSLAFLPDNSMLVTQRPGNLRHINSDGKILGDFKVSNVKEFGEGGLLGIALDPDFAKNKFIYLYYTYQLNGNETLNRVVRMTFDQNTLGNTTIVLDAIPGASNHNGGRLKFGPDGFLYISTGDAQEPSRAQDKNSLAGKILRVTPSGEPAPGNPFNNSVYSYGHRNVQGLAWDNQGNLWATEHGRSGVQSGFDELNLIRPGNNYGWPTIEGDKSQSGMVNPVIHSGSTTTWAPAGVAYLDNSLFFVGLRGQSLYQVNLEGGAVSEIRSHLSGEFGRLRDVVVGPDNFLYVLTSNRDGRGRPQADDDRILKINPDLL